MNKNKEFRKQSHRNYFEHAGLKSDLFPLIFQHSGSLSILDKARNAEKYPLYVSIHAALFLRGKNNGNHEKCLEKKISYLN